MTTELPPSRRSEATGGGSRFWIAGVGFVVASWVGSGVLLLLQGVVGLDPALLLAAQFGPTVGALVGLIVLRATRRGDPAGRPRPPVRVVLARTALAALAVAGLIGLYLAAMAVAGQPIRVTDVGTLGWPFWLIATSQLAGACGEELGWRTFLQRHLESRWSTMASAVVVGVLWGTWHLQYYRFGPAFMASFVVTTVAISVVLGVLVRNTGRWSLLIAGTGHWLLNLGILLFATFENGGTRVMAFLAAASIPVAAVAALLAHRHRSRAPDTVR